MASVNKFDSEPMTEKRKRSLTVLLLSLRTGIIASNMKADLHIDAGGFLNDLEIGDVFSEQSPARQVQRMIDILKTKSNGAYKAFCLVLKNRGYQHWVRELKKEAGEWELERNQDCPSPKRKAANNRANTIKPSFVIMTANENEFEAARHFLQDSSLPNRKVNFFDKKMKQNVSFVLDPSLKEKVKEIENVQGETYKVFSVGEKQGILMRCTNMGGFTREGSNWHTFKLLRDAKENGWPIEAILIVGCCGAQLADGRHRDDQVSEETIQDETVAEEMVLEETNVKDTIDKDPNGTILVAKHIHQYLIGKMEKEGTHYKTRSHSMSTGWTEYIEQSKVADHTPLSTPDHTAPSVSKLLKVDMYSGDFVIKDEKAAEQLRGNRRRVGFEMEGFGVIHALNVFKKFFSTWNPPEQSSSVAIDPDVVLVKGVSDNAGEDKNAPKDTIFFSETVRDVDENTRQHMCTVMSLTLVLRAIINKWG